MLHLLEKPKKFFPVESPFMMKADLRKLNPEKKVFDIDSEYAHFMLEKRFSRAEDLGKYHQVYTEEHPRLRHASRYVLQTLALEYPEFFQTEINFESEQLVFHCRLTKDTLTFNQDYDLVEARNRATGLRLDYKNSLDALASQLQEDVAIITLNPETGKDFVSDIHVCYPNGWSPKEIFGKGFTALHREVPDIDKLGNHKRIVRAMINGSYERFAWGITFDERLNRHPEVPKDYHDPENWKRTFNVNNPRVFLRVERQPIIGFPENNTALFLIRPYITDVKYLSSDQRSQLASSIQSMSPEIKKYKGLESESIVSYIRSLNEN